MYARVVISKLESGWESRDRRVSAKVVVEKGSTPRFGCKVWK